MWYENDKFYQSLNEEEKQEFLKQINTYMISSTQSIGKKRRGPIRDCPTCKEKRTTDGGVCSCASCLTCGYNWFCYPYFRPEQNTAPKGLLYFKELSPDYIDFP